MRPTHHSGKFTSDGNTWNKWNKWYKEERTIYARERKEIQRLQRLKRLLEYEALNNALYSEGDDDKNHTNNDTRSPKNLKSKKFKKFDKSIYTKSAKKIRTRSMTRYNKEKKLDEKDKILVSNCNITAEGHRNVTLAIHELNTKVEFCCFFFSKPCTYFLFIRKVRKL